MSEKYTVTVDRSSSYRLLHPMHTVLVSCGSESEESNIITLAWAMPASINPPLVTLSIAPQRHSHQLIEETKEFVVNLPTLNHLKDTLFCGRRSGKTHNKFEETEFTPLPAKKVNPPIIKECIAHLECRLKDTIETGDHTLFIGEVVKSYADKGVFDNKYNLEKAKMVYHLGGDDFAVLDPEIFSPNL